MKIVREDYQRRVKVTYQDTETEERENIKEGWKLRIQINCEICLATEIPQPSQMLNSVLTILQM